MTEGESDMWLHWLNSKFRHGEALVPVRGPLGLSGCIRLFGLDALNVSWPSADFCVFGADSRLPSCKYTSIFEMALPGWSYHGDVQAFAENNRWMRPYAGCASQEELILRILVNKDDPYGLLRHES